MELEIEIGPVLIDDPRVISNDGKCLTEIGLDLHSGDVVLAHTSNFKKETFGQCLHFCMDLKRPLEYVLISYYNAVLFGDKVSFYFRLCRFIQEVGLFKRSVLASAYGIRTTLKCMC